MNIGCVISFQVYSRFYLIMMCFAYEVHPCFLCIKKGFYEFISDFKSTYIYSLRRPHVISKGMALLGRSRILTSLRFSLSWGILSLSINQSNRLGAKQQNLTLNGDLIISFLVQLKDFNINTCTHSVGIIGFVGRFASTSRLTTPRPVAGHI